MALDRFIEALEWAALAVAFVALANAVAPFFDY